MQIRPWTYMQFTSLRRSLRLLLRPLDFGATAETSPLLIYVAVVLAFLFVVLESDAHQVELQSLGILTNNYPVPAALLGL